eukprot:COSAG06_NODE_2068_length_7675_cov_8.333421_7_plen_115_part_00
MALAACSSQRVCLTDAPSSGTRRSIESQISTACSAVAPSARNGIALMKTARCIASSIVALTAQRASLGWQRAAFGQKFERNRRHKVQYIYMYVCPQPVFVPCTTNGRRIFSMRS